MTAGENIRPAGSEIQTATNRLRSAPTRGAVPSTPSFTTGFATASASSAIPSSFAATFGAATSAGTIVVATTTAATTLAGGDFFQFEQNPRHDD